MKDHLAGMPNGAQDVLGSGWGAGDIMYADLNGDGQISRGNKTLADHGDVKKIGNSTPRYNFGLNLDARLVIVNKISAETKNRRLLTQNFSVKDLGNV